MSNTEPILRLNVESRGDEKLMKEKTEGLLKIIRSYKDEGNIGIGYKVIRV
ncbi:MAG: hypothetical protein WBQ32_03175 [Ignavibacteriaceae bacterium]